MRPIEFYTKRNKTRACSGAYDKDKTKEKLIQHINESKGEGSNDKLSERINLSGASVASEESA